MSGILSPKTSLLNLSNRLKIAQELEEEAKKKSLEENPNNNSIPINAETERPLIKAGDKVNKEVFGKKRKNKNGEECSEYSSVGTVRK